MTYSASCMNLFRYTYACPGFVRSVRATTHGWQRGPLVQVVAPSGGHPDPMRNGEIIFTDNLRGSIPCGQPCHGARRRDNSNSRQPRPGETDRRSSTFPRGLDATGSHLERDALPFVPKTWGDRARTEDVRNRDREVLARHRRNNHSLDGRELLFLRNNGRGTPNPKHQAQDALP